MLSLSLYICPLQSTRPHRARPAFDVAAMSLHKQLGPFCIDYKVKVSVSATSIHAPHAGCDASILYIPFCLILPIWYTFLFQSLQFTHPMRGATWYTSPKFQQDTSPLQSTHPMRGATWYTSPKYVVHFSTSIHAPHAGCDDGSGCSAMLFLTLQSTHPLRGRHNAEGLDVPLFVTSIHAPSRGATH